MVGRSKGEEVREGLQGRRGGWCREGAGLEIIPTKS